MGCHNIQFAGRYFASYLGEMRCLVLLGLMAVVSVARGSGVSVLSTQSHIYGDWEINGWIYFPYPDPGIDSFDLTGTFDHLSSSPAPVTAGTDFAPYFGGIATASLSPFSLSIECADPPNSSPLNADGSVVGTEFANIYADSSTTFTVGPSVFSLNITAELFEMYSGEASSLIILTDETASSVLFSINLDYWNDQVPLFIDTTYLFNLDPTHVYNLEHFSEAHASDGDYDRGMLNLTLSAPDGASTGWAVAASVLVIAALRRSRCPVLRKQASASIRWWTRSGSN